MFRFITLLDCVMDKTLPHLLIADNKIQNPPKMSITTIRKHIARALKFSSCGFFAMGKEERNNSGHHSNIDSRSSMYDKSYCNNSELSKLTVISPQEYNFF